jgi:hypothetical protein
MHVYHPYLWRVETVFAHAVKGHFKSVQERKRRHVPGPG